MDYRKREYFGLRLYDFEKELKFLKERVPSLKVLRPYNHYHTPVAEGLKFMADRCNLCDVHDSNVLNQYIQIVVSCKAEESFELMYTFINDMDDENGENYRAIIPYTKKLLGQ